MRTRRHGRLFWRVYLHGLLLLLVAGRGRGGRGGRFARAEAPWHQRGRRAATYAAARVADALARPGAARGGARARRARPSASRRRSTDRTAAVLADERRSPPLDRRSPAHPRAPGRPVRLRRHGLGWAVPLADGGRLPRRRRRGRRPIQLRGPRRHRRGARWRSRSAPSRSRAPSPSPLERLTAAAPRLGAGDLSARAGCGRRGEVGELARAFDEMAERLERLVRAEQELLANVSHELRTPLARIRVALELAAEGDAERARRYLDEIGADLDELERLVEDVLTAARLDLAAGGARPAPRASAVDLGGAARARRRRASARRIPAARSRWTPRAAPGASTPTRRCSGGSSTTCSTTRQVLRAARAGDARRARRATGPP